jgi:hypothetical protein
MIGGIQTLEDLPERFQTAAKLAFNKILEQPDVIGFVLAGSVAQGTSDEHSDLDFYVVTDGNQRWRGCWILEGTPVEYFFNPYWFLQTRIEHDAAALHMLATGIVMLEHPELTKLQRQARELLAQPPSAKPENELEFDRFNAMEYVFETRSVLGTRNHAYFLPKALEFMLTAIYRKNRWWEVKAKQMLKDFEARAPEPARFALEVLRGSTQEIRQAALERLAREIIDPLEQIEYSSGRELLKRN